MKKPSPTGPAIVKALLHGGAVTLRGADGAALESLVLVGRGGRYDGIVTGITVDDAEGKTLYSVASTGESDDEAAAGAAAYVTGLLSPQR